ncbi:hypothetical protein SNEBB_003441, partial [Seison nebaliae]
QEEELVKNVFKISWTSSYKKLLFELQIDSKYKWFGFGLSPNGGMKGADIFIVETIDNKLIGKDYYSSGTTRPVEDDVQSFNVISSDNRDGFQRVLVERDRITCDVNEDLAVTIGRIKCIYAYGTTNTMKYHSDNEGTVGLPLFNPKFPRSSALPNHLLKVNYAKPQYKIPNVDTTYHCSLFKANMTTTKDFVYIYRTEAIIPEDTKEFVHHFLLYFCPPDVTDKVVGDLETTNTPCFDSKFQLTYSTCATNIIGGWAVGGELIFDFPPEAAYKFNTEFKYFLLETHYDNPGLKSGKIDTSGMALYYSETPRKYSAGTLYLGARVPGNILIPPKVQKSNMMFPCPSECTSNYVDKEGINVFTAFLHSHLTGVAIKTSIIRNKTEIDFLGRADSYDFDYQDFIKLQKPVKVLPGDELRTECLYSTIDRKQLTKGGLSTHEEMCINILYYYPADEFSLRTCLSEYSREPFVKFGAEMIKKKIFPENFNMKNCLENLDQDECISEKQYGIFILVYD